MSSQQTSSSSCVRKLPIGREHIECDECSRPGPRMMCSRCKAAFYCNKACQKKDWKNWHKQHCMEIGRVERIQNFGRFADMLAPAPEPINTSCFICLNETIKDPFILPECGHAFCFVCLQKWQAVSPIHNCPVCRNETPDVVDSALQTASLHWCRSKDKALDKTEQKRHCQLALDELEQIDPCEVKYFHQIKRILFKKAQIFLDLQDPKKALKVCEEIKRNVREGDPAYLEQSQLYWLLKGIALESYIQQKKNRCRHKPDMGRDVFQLFLLMARCYETMEEYDDAIETYITLGQIMGVYWKERPGTNLNLSTCQEMFQLKYGLCMCLYKTKCYEAAIDAGKEAIEINRSFPLVHQYVALSQRDSGNIEGAVRTMGRALTYEAPWDKSYYSANLKLYNELKQVASNVDQVFHSLTRLGLQNATWTFSHTFE